MAITTITVYKMRWHIRYWIYLIRAKHRNYTRLSNTDYVYDGFVVYCDADRKWVHEKLVPVLEEEYGHTLCIHYRDFQVGKLIVDNIVESMKESRKVILVMSNAFARSEWCQFEVILAHERFLKNGSDTLVTVLLEDVSSRHFTNALKIILTSTTYAIWSETEEGQRLFWNQLLSTFKSDQPPDYERIRV
jgi:toll-like receptor 13